MDTLGLILCEMRAGATKKEAARRAGTTHDHVYRWLVKGRAGDPVYADFAREYDALRAAQRAKREARNAADPLGHRRSVARVRERRQAGRAAAHGAVYFIEAPVVGRVKIGWTSRHDEVETHRLPGLQTGSPVPLELLAVVPGTLEHERHAHRAWAAARTHGEWFTLTPELRVFIEHALRVGISAALDAAPALVEHGVGRCKLTAEQVREIRAIGDRESKGSLARRFGVTRRAITFILRGETWAHAG